MRLEEAHPSFLNPLGRRRHAVAPTRHDARNREKEMIFTW
jgi:hypothetical protein